MSVSRTVFVTKDNWILQRVGSTVKYGNGSTGLITVGPAASATDATIVYKGRGLYSISAASMNTLLTGLGSLSVATADLIVAPATCGARGATQKIYLEEITGDFTTNSLTGACSFSTAGGASAVWPGPTATTVNRVLLQTSGLATNDTISFNILPLLRARLAAGNLGVFRFRLIAANTTGGYDEANTARTVALYGSAQADKEPSVSVTGELAAAAVSVTPATAQGTGVAQTPTGVGDTDTISKFLVDGEFGIISMRAQSDVKHATLDTLSVRDAKVMISFTVNRLPTGATTILRLLTRYIDVSNHYRLSLRLNPDGSVILRYAKVVAGVVTTLGSVDPGLTLVPGTTYFMHDQAKGATPSTLSGKLWAQGTSEPDWQLVKTDSQAALQTAGAVGIGSETGLQTNLPQEWYIDEFTAVAA